MSVRLSLRTQVLRSLAHRSIRTPTRALGTFAATPPTPFVGPSPHILKAHNEEKLHEYASYLTLCMPKYIQAYAIQHGELCLHTSPSGLLPLCEFLRDHTACQYRQVVDICGVDYPTRKDRFEVVYNLLSHSLNQRIRVKCRVGEGEPLESVTGIWSGANWYEREAWDMFGIFFVGHPDLRRILTDYGFEGHPLRKDFPLTGYTEVRYSEEHKRVIQEPVQLTQAFRDFSGAASPWEQVGSGIDVTPEKFKVAPPKPAEEEKK